MKKNMIKLLGLALVLCLALSLAACSKGSESAQQGSGNADNLVSIELDYDSVLMVTKDGNAYFMNEEHADEPYLAAQNVKSAFLGSDALRSVVDYIDNNGNYYSNSVNMKNGGVYENELRYENVEQIVPIMDFAIYRSPDGKVYIDKFAAAFVSASAAYGGTTELHDHELVAENGQTVVTIAYRGAYLNDKGELWGLEDNEWKLLCDNVAQVCETSGMVPLVLKKDGTLCWTTGSDGTVAFDEGVDEIYAHTNLYRKGDRFYRVISNYSNNWEIVTYSLDNIKTPIWTDGSAFVYIGTDSQIHCTKLSSERIENGWNETAFYDAAYPASVDSMDEIYNFLKTADDIQPEEG